jgi:hypothetical protein
MSIFASTVQATILMLAALVGALIMLFIMALFVSLTMIRYGVFL